MNNILEVQCSVCKNVFSSEVLFNHSLYHWLTEGSIEWQNEIAELRKYKNKDLRKMKQHRLPAITVSGTFNGIRRAENLEQHSGLLCIDIDAQDNLAVNNWKDLKDKLTRNNPYIAYAGLSTSGIGLYLIIAIEDPDRHLEYFNTLEDYFLEAWDIVIDKACKNVNRLRTISFDPDPYFNLQAKPLANYKTKKTIDDFKGDFSDATLNHNQLRIREIEKAILARKLDITAIYGDWFKVGCVINKYFGADGQSIFQNISKFHKNYDREKTARQYEYITERKLDTDKGYKLGSLIQLFKEFDIGE